MLVSFVGFIGSGKGLAGDILVKHGFIRESWAKTVKDAIAPIFGWDRDLLEGDSVQSRAFREEPDAYWSKVMGKAFTPRHALQLMGTEAGRNVFHTDLWIHSLLKRIDPNLNYVITDTRFPNELRTIYENGGKTVRIKRGTDPWWFDVASNWNNSMNWDGSVQHLPILEDPHYSEWAWIGNPWIGPENVIENNGTVEQLENHLLRILDIKE